MIGSYPSVPEPFKNVACKIGAAWVKDFCTIGNSRDFEQLSVEEIPLFVFIKGSKPSVFILHCDYPVRDLLLN
jgi:hypothetical protein